MIQIIILAGVALFLILRLRNVLGTREGFEKPRELPDQNAAPNSGPAFEVIDGGGVDHDIAHVVDPESDAGKALAAMKRIDPDFTVGEFAHGARSAYEMIVMAYENGDIDVLRDFLAPDVFESFAAAIDERVDKGYTVEAHFHGIREVKLADAHFAEDTNEADITMRFVGELTSMVKDSDGEIVEGGPNDLKQQRDVWTFSRDMSSDNPNWLLTGTGG
ncbi:MAG: Tim44/TimA family putative adaptor protein [Pseudomonadota bacterium]